MSSIHSFVDRPDTEIILPQPNRTLVQVPGAALQRPLASRDSPVLLGGLDDALEAGRKHFARSSSWLRAAHQCSSSPDSGALLNVWVGNMEMDADPVSRMFLDNLREDGTSYIFEVAGDLHHPALRIKYEEVRQSNVPVEKRTRDVLRTLQKKTPDNSGRTDLPKRLFHEKSTHVGSLPLEDSTTDESVKLFFDHLRVEDGLVVFDLKPGIVIRYEEVKGISDASPNLQAEATLFRGEHELVPYTEPCGIGGAGQLKEHACNTRAIVPCLSDVSSRYKQNLLEVLIKPYDQKEYNQLLKEATERKPSNKQKHLCGMSVSYATNIPGMSYFDHHPDLAKQFEQADSYRGLALLHGLFFWLKNLCHEGSFIPWASSNAEMLSTCCYALMLPPDESPLNAISENFRTL